MISIFIQLPVTDKLYYLDMIVYSLKVEYVQHFRHLEINRLNFGGSLLTPTLYVHHAQRIKHITVKSILILSSQF
jgi:hypothetical protein